MRAARCAACTPRSTRSPPASRRAIDWSEPHAARFRAAMNDDFNTPTRAGGAVRAGRRGQPHAVAATPRAAARRSAATLGVLQQAPRAFLQARRGARRGDDRARASTSARAAKRRKRLRRGRRIRDELLAQGIVLKDSAAAARPGSGPEPARTTCATRAVAAATPDYWDDACKHLARRDRVMKQADPAVRRRPPAEPRRRLHHAGALDRRPADLGEGGAGGLGPLRRADRRRRRAA